MTLSSFGGSNSNIALMSSQRVNTFDQGIRSANENRLWCDRYTGTETDRTFDELHVALTAPLPA